MAPSASGFGWRGNGGRAVLLTLGGEVCERRSFDTTSDPVAAIEKVALSMTIARGSSVRMLGVGVASEDPGAHDLGRLTETGLFSRVFFERDCVTALLAEFTFGVGRVEGGIMLIIVDQRVRAGFLFRGAPFGGVHNRAGSIGLMRTGADHVPLDFVAGLGAFWGEVELEEDCSLQPARTSRSARLSAIGSATPQGIWSTLLSRRRAFWRRERSLSAATSPPTSSRSLLRRFPWNGGTPPCGLSSHLGFRQFAGQRFPARASRSAPRCYRFLTSCCRRRCQRSPKRLSGINRSI